MNVPKDSGGDLRKFVRALEESGELQSVKREVDWNLEIGGITRRLIDTRGPAALFENIKGHPGQRMLALPFGPSRPLHARLAVSLGLPKETPPLELIEHVTKKLARPVRPRVVDDAPFKENVMKGDRIDVTRFPAPLIHSMDGGRYIGTWCIVITKDPQSPWTNWGVYRVMLHDRRTLVVNFNLSAQHGGEMLAEHERTNPNSPYEVAVVIGADPISLMAAAANSPRKLSEAWIAGALRGSPAELVKCETIDVHVPSSSEVVIEGEVSADQTLPEGPMGEFTGYSSGATRRKPYLRIKCISFRRDPIITFANMGKPWDDFAVVSSVVYSANIKMMLARAGLPVEDVYTWPFETAVISIKRQRADTMDRVIRVLKDADCRTGQVYSLIVGEDIDVTNLEDVFWCLATRLHPRNGIHVETQRRASPLIPLLTPEERGRHAGPRAFLDCTWPSTWTAPYLKKHCKVVDFVNGWPKSVRDRVIRNWSDYGFESRVND